MPIANCFIHKKYSIHADYQQLVREWAQVLQISETDITLNVITDHKQFGQQYPAMINLFLPSLWSEKDIEKIQRTLSELLQKHLKIESDEVFIMISLINSGHVFSEGKVERWEESRSPQFFSDR